MCVRFIISTLPPSFSVGGLGIRLSFPFWIESWVKFYKHRHPLTSLGNVKVSALSVCIQWYTGANNCIVDISTRIGLMNPYISLVWWGCVPPSVPQIGVPLWLYDDINWYSLIKQKPLNKEGLYVGHLTTTVCRGERIRTSDPLLPNKGTVYQFLLKK